MPEFQGPYTAYILEKAEMGDCSIEDLEGSVAMVEAHPEMYSDEFSQTAHQSNLEALNILRQQQQHS